MGRKQKMSKVICFYHSRDLDGWTSAAIVKKKFPEAKLVGWDYGDPEPLIYDVEYEGEVLNPLHPTIDVPVDLRIPNNAKVIIVDISFNPVTMIKLKGYVKMDVIWIDHHKSAIKDAVEYDYALLNGRRRSDFAACELTWQFFFSDSEMPEAVRLLGMYDSFRHKGSGEEHKVMIFQYGARGFVINPSEAEIFFDMNEQQIRNILSSGKAIFDYLIIEAKGIYAKAFPVEIEEYPGLMVNRERFNPVNFGIDYHKDGYDFFGCFWFDGENYSFSLYNDNGELDVSYLCKKFGGGGHAGAAGFTTKDFESVLTIPPE